MKVQLDLSKDQMLASIYNDKLNTDQGKPVNPAAPLDQIADADAEKFLNAPANKAVYDAKLKKFLVFLADLAKTAEIPDDPNGAGTKFAVTQWKKVVYGAARAKQSGLVTKAVDLQARMQQSLVLSREYSRQKLSALIEPTPAEVDAFVKVNPQYSKAPYLARAEEILKKANAGEDFAGLANKYTEDPGNKDQATGQTNGGLYDWSDRARYVGPFSDGAWALNENQISGIVETEYGFHILKLEGKRTVKNVDGKDEQQVKVRHILVLTNYNDGSNPPMPLAEAAKKAIETKKQETVLADIIARNPVDLPADFAFTAVAEKPVAAAKPPAKTTRPAARVTKKTH